MQRLTSKLFSLHRSLLKSSLIPTLPRVKPALGLSFYSSQAPKRFYQNPNLVDWHQITCEEYDEVFNQLQACASCEDVAGLMKMNLDILADTLLVVGIEQIAQGEFELDAYFYNDIVPILMALIPKMDQHNQQSFGIIVTALGHMDVQHEEMWAVVESKILEGRMYRYMGIRDICAAACTLGTAGRLSAEVSQKFEQVLSKHGASLRLQDAAGALKGFKRAGRGSPEFLAYLESGDFREEDNILGNHPSPRRLPPKSHL
jgi:hypothetical protein